MAKLKPFTEDRGAARQALAILASLRTPMASDMSYKSATGTRGRNEATQLAEVLLIVKARRAGAFDALVEMLEVREADRSCGRDKEVLPRVRAPGDGRSLLPLGTLSYRNGCGGGG